jgi:hypothetical protein
MGNLVLIEIFLNGDIRNGSYRSNVGEDFVVLDQLSRLFKRFWRAVGIVERIKFTFLRLMPPFSFNI